MLQAAKKLTAGHLPCNRFGMLGGSMIIALLLAASAAVGRSQVLAWQAQLQTYAERKDWDSAMQLVEQEIARAPQDMDVRAWRARVLAWSGKLSEAEKEYLAILRISPADPDDWMGIADVYLQEGKIQEAQQAINAAEELDPKRSDIHVARAHILRAAGQRGQARAEFQSALRLDAASQEAREGLIAARRGVQNELQFGEDNDLLSYSPDFHHESVTVASRWNSYWSTSVAAEFYERPGVEAGKFGGSVTRRQPEWGALTLGAAVGHDNAVIPKSEAFFDLDHGWKTGETGFVRGVEVDFAQHWYWYQSARILKLTGTTLVYLPGDWTFSLAPAGARSAFSGTTAEWKPSGIARLGFPLARWEERRLTGNLSFAAGTEDFAVVDQIGSLSSQTYGGGVRLLITAGQDVTAFAGYQRRTQNRSDMMFGVGYGIHF